MPGLARSLKAEVSRGPRTLPIPPASRVEACPNLRRRRRARESAATAQWPRGAAKAPASPGRPTEGDEIQHKAGRDERSEQHQPTPATKSDMNTKTMSTTGTERISV